MEIYSRKFGRRSILLLIFTVLVYCFLFLSFSMLENSKKTFEKTIKRSKINALVAGSRTKFCDGNLLDKREYHYAKEAGGTYDNSQLISKLGSCQLLHYTFEEAVGCFDALYERHYSARNSYSNLNHINSSNKRLHFAFVGDSRIRQQFFNFLKMIPDYDTKSQPSSIPVRYHGDIEVTSDILKLRISFKWQPLINDTIIDTIRQWSTEGQSDRPHLIVIGIAVWHMLQSEGADHQLYQEKLKELAPFLGQLANVIQVVWLNQYPTLELYGKIDAHNTDIFSEKIYHYNQIARHLLQNQLFWVRIWDSSNSVVEEYIRGCAFSQRIQQRPFNFVDPANSYINCDDYTHAGYSALSQSTQLLFNDLCNAYYTSYRVTEQ